MSGVWVERGRNEVRRSALESPTNAEMPLMRSANRYSFNEIHNSMGVPKSP